VTVCLAGLVQLSYSDYTEDSCPDCLPCSSLCRCRATKNRYEVYCNGLQDRDSLANQAFSRHRCINKFHVDEFIFKNLSSLTFPAGMCVNRLHLKRDAILNVHEDTFKHFHNITEVVLSEIQFITDSQPSANFRGILQALTKINTTFSLAVDSIRLDNITEEDVALFSKLNIDELRLNRNELEELKMRFVSRMVGLKSLSMNFNRIEKIVHLNGSVSNITSLELKANRLSHETIVFCNLDGNSSFPRLEVLHLDTNSISNITADTFKCLRSLKELYLAENKIKNFDLNVISVAFPELEKMSLRKNWLTNNNPFNYTSSLPFTLNYLDLSENEFSPWMPYFCNTTNHSNNITVLDLRYNHISKLTNASHCFTNVTILYLSKNALNSLTNVFFESYFPNLEELYLVSQLNGISSMSTTTFSHPKLRILDLKDNYIRFENHRGIFSENMNLKSLNVSDNFISDLTAFTAIASPLKSLEVLAMKRTGLKVFPYKLVSTLSNLKNIYVSMNHITTLAYQENDTFTGVNISYIDLQKNQIIFSKESYFPDAFSSQLMSVHMAYNIFGCSCNISDREFRTMIRDNDSSAYIGKTKLVGWPGAYKCRMSKTLLRYYRKTARECDNTYDIRLVLYSAVGATAFVSIVLSSVVFWNRWFVQYYFHKFKRRMRQKKRKKTNNDEEQRRLIEEDRFPKDAFVIHSSDSQHFVHNEFRTLVEDRLKYSLNIYAREGPLGLWIQDAYFEAMDTSKHFIVIVDTKLMKDEWCQFQVDVAINLSMGTRKRQKEKQRRMFLVLLEDVDFTASYVKKSWCVLFTKTPSSKWCGQRNNMRHDVFIEDLKDILGEPQRHSRETHDLLHA